MRYSNKRFLFIPLIIFFLSCTKLFAQNTDRLIGKWELLSIETDTAKIEFPKSEKFKKQNEIHEKIRNDEDYDDWDYGTEPFYGNISM